MVLPSFFMLKSGGRYLSVTENIPANLPSGFLKFDQEQIWSPRAKFAAEPAETGDGRRLFHIRSVYNNKYLVMKQIDELNSWIVASAKKPEEDKSQASSCTLFEPHSLADDDDDDDDQSVRLRHVGTGISATHSLSPGDDTHQGVLLSSIGSSFILTDSNSVPALPSRIAIQSEYLKGDYLGSITLYDNLVYQKFQSGLDNIDQRVVKELSPTADGKYRITDQVSNVWGGGGNVWTRRDNWIKVESDNYSTDTYFSFVKIEDYVFGLRNLGNNNFCGPYTEDDSVNCLCAIYPTLTKQTRLILVETVAEREIFDVEYRLSDSRIYDEQVQEIDHQFATNDTPYENTMTKQFSTTVQRTTSWNNSVSVKVGGKVSFKISYVPFIAESKVELSMEAGNTYQWGESNDSSQTIGSSYTVTIPPLTTIKVTMLATKGVCDVPFSYTQRDISITGDPVVIKKDDGIFTGINSSDVHFKTEVVPA